MSEVAFYVNNSDSRVLNKNLTRIKTITQQFKILDDTDILNPTILIKRNFAGLDSYRDFTKCNYVYLSATARYYFIESVEMRNGGIIAFKLKVDVLQSWSSYIGNVTGIIERNEFVSSPYYIDNKQILTSGRIMDRYDISNNFFSKSLGSDSNCIALTVNGG